MDSDTPHPLTPEEAKARLRAAAESASPAAWLQQHPWNTLGIAIAAGFVMSRMRLPMAASVMTTQWLGPLLLRAVMRRAAKKLPRKS